MFGFNKQKTTNTQNIVPTYLAVDIGTEYIKSVVYMLDDNTVEVIGYDRTKQDETSMYGAFIINLQEVIDAVDKSVGRAINNAENYLGDKVILPKKVIMGIAGELVQGVTILVNVARENPDEVITENEVNNIVAKVKKNSFESTKEDIAFEIGVKPQQIEEINTAINSVYVDNIKTISPVGLKGYEMVYRVFSTFAPKVHLESIKSVAETLRLDLQQVVVQPYAVSLALKNSRSRDTNAIFIDIGGGTTDVALIQHGDIIGTKMFAIGGRVFTKRLQKDFNLEYEEAESLKIEYSNGNIKGDKQSDVKKSINKDIPAWLTGLQIALEDFEDVEEYPTEIYICGGGALLPEIQEGILAHPWLQTLKFKKFPKVNFFFPSKIANVVDKTRSATMPMDVTPLALARMILE